MARVSERWDFRVAPETDELVRRAAEAADRSLTEFVVAAARIEAERILADRTTFVLSPEQWERFVNVLERPERDNPGLLRLFSKPSVLEPDDE